MRCRFPSYQLPLAEVVLGVLWGDHKVAGRRGEDTSRLLEGPQGAVVPLPAAHHARCCLHVPISHHLGGALCVGPEGGFTLNVQHEMSECGTFNIGTRKSSTKVLIMITSHTKVLHLLSSSYEAPHFLSPSFLSGMHACFVCAAHHSRVRDSVFRKV